MIEANTNSAQQFKKAFSYACKNSKTFLLDGSMGSYLHRQCGVPRHETLWMLPALLEEKHHGAIVQAHKNYIQAGADIIQTFNYTCVPLYLKKGKCEDKINELNQTAALLARRAINQYSKQYENGRKIWLAGALPTPGQSYHHCHDMSEEEFDKTFQAIIHSIDKHSDFFIAQTIASSRDAFLIAKAAQKYAPEKMLFMSFTVNEHKILRTKETLTQAINYLQEQKVNIEGYGVNCSPFMVTNECLKQIRQCTNKPLITYPNFVQNYTEDYKPTESKGVSRTLLKINEENYTEEMKNMLQSNKGLVMIGGCCGFNPKKIELVRKIVPQLNAEM